MKLRRLVGVFASILLMTVVLVPGVSGAATRTTFSATGFWQLNDARHTAVSLEPTRARGEAPGVFVQIEQEFCDTRTDQEVFRGFAAQGPALALFAIDRKLHRASLAAVVTGHLVDQRLRSCSNPTGQPTTVDLGKVNVVLAAQWTGVGPIQPVQPGIVARSARAFGILSGPRTLRIGSLGSAEFAELRRTTL